jgi:DNA mismatch repair protein MutS
MVEMNETASIVNNISERSLILLDEIGRGTSTYDGISIAWSLAEYLHESPLRPKTLFATHYHELNELAGKYDRIKNFSISTREIEHQVIFLRKLIPGGSKSSFGIHVAKMAGMPSAIVKRAEELLGQLEQKSIEQGDFKQQVKQFTKPDNFQLNIFEAQNPTTARIMEVLKELDVNATTPVEALMKINELKKILEESTG